MGRIDFWNLVIQPAKKRIPMGIQLYMNIANLRLYKQQTVSGCLGKAQAWNMSGYDKITHPSSLFWSWLFQPCFKTSMVFEALKHIFHFSCDLPLSCSWLSHGADVCSSPHWLPCFSRCGAGCERDRARTWLEVQKCSKFLAKFGAKNGDSFGQRWRGGM